MNDHHKNVAIERRERSQRRIRRATAVAGAGAVVTGGLLTVALANATPSSTAATSGTANATPSSTAQSSAAQPSAAQRSGDDAGENQQTSVSTGNAPAPAAPHQAAVTTSGGSGH